MAVTTKGYLVRRLQDAPTVHCPCGESTRIITRADTPVVNVHLTHIQDAQKHYHRECTEVYIVVEGSGYMELGNETFPVEPGTVVVIEPGTTHRGYGDFKAFIIGFPALKPDDEFFTEEEGTEGAG